MGSLRVIVDRCGVVVGRCGSLWIVVARCGSFRVLVTTGERVSLQPRGMYGTLFSNCSTYTY